MAVKTERCPFSGLEAEAIQEISGRTIESAYTSILNHPIELSAPCINKFLSQDTSYSFFLPEQIAGNGDFYDLLQNRFTWYYAKEKWEYNKVFKVIDFTDKKTIEIGCGFGYFLEKLVNKKPSSATGLEINTVALKECEKKGLIVNPKNITELNPEERFDIIAMFQVLEHLTSPGAILKECINRLNRGGKLIIAVPNTKSILFTDKGDFTFANESHRLTVLLNMPPHHMGHWNEKSLTSISKLFPVKKPKFYFEPIWNDRKHLTDLLNYKYNLRLNTDNFIWKVLFRLTQPFIHGHTILAIYEKK